MIFVGVDGYRNGWLAAAVEDGFWRISTFPSIFQLWREYRDAELILIDIPIGLKDSGGERLCDIGARQMLGPRRMSVFRVPCRAAVYAASYMEGCEINRERTGKAFSKQTWNIVPKIKEVDILLRTERSARNKIRETHPEVCFRALAGRPMSRYKKTQEGHEERMRVLEHICLSARGILTTHGFMDDILDALAAAVTASGGTKLSTIPEVPEYDPEGLRMEIVYHLGDTGRPSKSEERYA